MLAKLSYRNAKRQTGDYIVYFITISLAAALIYAFNALALSPEIEKLSFLLENLKWLVVMASIAVVCVLAWLVYYTQRFMLAKRSRELATYMLLGVEKKQVIKMFTGENIVVGIVAFLIGLLGGNIIYQALQAIVMAMFKMPIKLSFVFSSTTVLLTAFYFALIFVFSTIMCRIRIKKTSIKGLIELDRQNEGEIVGKSKSRKRMFNISLICGVAGTALLITRNLTFGLIGCVLLIIFSYGFFISFSSGVPAFFEKRPKKKYKGNNLLVFRSLSTKLASMGVTMGTIAIIFTATLISEGSGMLFQNQFNHNSEQITNFDLFISAPAGSDDFTQYEPYIYENLAVESELRYKNYDSGSEDFINFLKNRASINSYYDDDQVIAYSDYAKLRNMLGYPEVKLAENSYLIHCLDFVAPYAEKYGENFETAGFSLKPGGVYSEVFTQYYWKGNGLHYIIVVPDNVIPSLSESMSMWAMMTTQPVDGLLYKGVTDIRDEISGTYVESPYYYTIYSRGYLKQEYASMSAMVVFPLFYLSLILVMVAATILTIQFLSDAKNLKKQYSILWDLGMDKKLLRRSLNKHFSIYFIMPLIPPLLIDLVFMFSLGSIYDAGVIKSSAHLFGIIGFSLLLFFAIYFIYTSLAVHNMKKNVLPK